MEVLVLAVGKPKLAYAKLGTEDYAGRLTHYVRLRLEFVKAGRVEEEGARLLAGSEGSVRIALDPVGWMGTTEGWLNSWTEWETDGIKKVSFLIGGAEGHSAVVREACERWSLGPLTMQHELALVVLLEQIYRVQTLKRGEPYHRG